jgi:hypothetical protein
LARRKNGDHGFDFAAVGCKANMFDTGLEHLIRAHEVPEISDF